MKKMIKHLVFVLSLLSNLAFASSHSAKCDYMPTATDDVVNFGSCEFNDDDVYRVMKNIPDHSLHVVDFSNNNLSAMSAKVIADKIVRSGNAFNAWLLLANNHLGDQGAKEFRDLSVSVVDLKNNYLTSQGIADIAHIANLKILHIGYNNLQPSDVSKLLKINSLVYLFMQQATFDENNINEMAHNKNLVGYSFADSNVTPDQLYRITNNKAFDILDLSGLNLTNEIFTSKKLFKSVDYLDLSDNPLLDFKKGVLVKSISINLSKKYSALLLANDNISDADVSDILSHFSVNGVYNINLSGTHVSNQLSEVIAKAKAHIQYLAIDNEAINVDGLQNLLNNNYVERIEVDNKLSYLTHNASTTQKNDVSSSHMFRMYQLTS